MTDLAVRRATLADLPAIVAMLADDHLGATREGAPDDPAYATAFAEIDADPHQRLVVGELDGEVIATMQLTIIPGIGRKGARRALIEAVRVRSDRRGGGLGKQLIGWAIETARTENCAMVQLTSDKSRTDAHRFYDRLGFTQSHVGYKLALPQR
ncbi:MAG: GNAT family N-acetyltransferase [Hamadaea sp.]|nr:GNAT family N-acetyltransferase [Hamadaea sp.]